MRSKDFYGPGEANRGHRVDGKVLPPNQEGHLQIRGAANFVGYMGRPEAYDTDADGWFKTGDLARIDADGYVRITGRSKDIIIRGGENIPVVEVEGLLFRHPAVSEVATRRHGTVRTWLDRRGIPGDGNGL